MFKRSKRWYVYTKKWKGSTVIEIETGFERSVCRDKRGISQVPLNNTDFFRFLNNSCEREVSEFQREFETDPAFPVSSLSKRLFLRDTNERQ